MAICTNDAYVVLGAGSPEFNDTYVRTGSLVPRDASEPFSIYTGQTNGYKIKVIQSGGPGSYMWFLSNSTDDSSNVGVNGHVIHTWGPSYGDAQQVNCISTFKRAGNNVGSASTPLPLITTPQSLRSTREKLYVHISDVSPEIMNGEYTLQPDAYNNFSWWKNIATGAVVVLFPLEPTTVSGTPGEEAGIFVSIRVYRNKQQADNDPNNNAIILNSFVLQNNSTTPPEMSPLPGRALSYQPFREPLPRNTDFDALTGFFGRTGLAFDFFDKDKYGLYTFKGGIDLWRGNYEWRVNLNNPSLGVNVLFLEWIKSLQPDVDYKLDGKKILLNSESSKLNNISGINGENTLELKNLNTAAFKQKDTVTLTNSKINNITVGNINKLNLNGITSLNGEGSNLNINGYIDSQLFLDLGTPLASISINKEDAFKTVENFSLSGSNIDLIPENAREDFISKLAESETVIIYQLGALFADDKVEAITNPVIKAKVTTKRAAAIARAAAGGSGSGSDSGGGGTSIGLSDYLALATTRNQFSKIATGANHTLALSGTKLFVTGYNYTGQLGLGSYPYQNFNVSPAIASSTGVTSWVNIPGDFTDIAAGVATSFALSGTALYSCGNNTLSGSVAFTGQSRSGSNLVDIFGNTYNQSSGEPTSIWSLVPGNWKKVSVGFGGNLVALLSSNNTLFRLGNNTIYRGPLGYNVNNEFVHQYKAKRLSGFTSEITVTSLSSNNFGSVSTTDTPYPVYNAVVSPGAGYVFLDINDPYVKLDDISIDMSDSTRYSHDEGTFLGLSGNKLITFGKFSSPAFSELYGFKNEYPGSFDRIRKSKNTSVALSGTRMFLKDTTLTSGVWQDITDDFADGFGGYPAGSDLTFENIVSIDDVWVANPNSSTGYGFIAKLTINPGYQFNRVPGYMGTVNVSSNQILLGWGGMIGYDIHIEDVKIFIHNSGFGPYAGSYLPPYSITQIETFTQYGGSYIRAMVLGGYDGITSPPQPGQNNLRNFNAGGQNSYSEAGIFTGNYQLGAIDYLSNQWNLYQV